MKKVSLFIFAGLIALAGFSCAVKTGTPVEYSKACDAENEKKYIEVVGFLDDGGSMLCSNAGGGPVRCGFKLLESPGAAKGFTADIQMGTVANTVSKLDRSYKKEDIRVRDNAGDELHLPQKVKVVGQQNVAKDPTNAERNVCYLTVVKIEKQ